MEIKSNQILKHKYCIICDAPFCRSASKEEGEDTNALTVFCIVAINILFVNIIDICNTTIDLNFTLLWM